MNEPLSVVIITLNEADKLEACLQSVDFANEILIVDSGSSDDTLEIANNHQARIIKQEWLGYGKQKRFAAEQAAHDWILSIDADEQVSDELRAGIQEAMKSPGYQAYQMPRRNRFMGRWLRHGEGYPDLSLRLYNRNYANWSEDPVHEKVVTQAPVGRLKGDLLHESESSIAEYLEKQNSYTSLQAETLYARGKRSGVVKIILSPLFRFIKFYFLRLGFLDGIPGLVHILIGCNNSMLKYTKLRELHRGN